MNRRLEDTRITGPRADRTWLLVVEGHEYGAFATLREARNALLVLDGKKRSQRALREAQTRAHAETMGHVAHCEMCAHGSFVSDMCQEGQRLTAVSREATDKMEEAYA